MDELADKKPQVTTEDLSSQRQISDLSKQLLQVVSATQQLTRDSAESSAHLRRENQQLREDLQRHSEGRRDERLNNLEQLTEVLSKQVTELQRENATLRENLARVERPAEVAHTPQNNNVSRRAKVMQKLDVAGEKVMSQLTTKWRLRIPGIRGHGQVVTGDKEARCLVYLLAHYPFIVYLGFSFWRHLLILSVRKDHVPLSGSYTPEDQGSLGHLSSLHTMLPKVFFQQRIPASFANLKSWDGEVDHFASFIKGVMKNNQVDVAAVLVKELQINLTDRPGQNRGQTALHQAAGSGHVLISKLLLQHGAEGDTRDTKKLVTPLHVAAEDGHLAVVELLLNLKDGTVGKEEEGGREQSAWRSQLLAQQNSDNKDPLRLAVQGHHVAVARVLLTAGANLRDCDCADSGATLLHQIARRRTIGSKGDVPNWGPMLELLLGTFDGDDEARKKYIAKVDNEDETALSIAKLNDTTSVVRFFTDENDEISSQRADIASEDEFRKDL